MRTAIVSDEEIAASVLEPHFCAVRDLFSQFEPEPGLKLSKLAKVQFVIDSKVHDKPRHFAATYEEKPLMVFAPQIVDLGVETVVAILAHEFGHAADFQYPSRWYTHARGPCVARWIDSKDVERKLKNGNRVDTKPFRAWSKAWSDRGRDQVEWAADGIAEAVTGKHITYDGPLVLQCLHGHGIERPKGLR
jgi:hypothetical protein